MSNLLSNNQNKKKLLNRGPKITPSEEFSIEMKYNLMTLRKNPLYLTRKLLQVFV